MIIRALKITPETAIKVFEKHNVLQEEIYDALKTGKPRFKKAGGDQYIAIGLSQSRYVTIYFSYDKRTREAEIKTAYPSSKVQVKAYKKTS